LKLKGQQTLRNILRDLGWTPALHRIDGKQKRVWGRVSFSDHKRVVNADVKIFWTI